MSAKIKLPNGPEASMDDQGIWTCDEYPDIAGVLQTASVPYVSQDHLPDPFEHRLNGVARDLGAQVIAYEPAHVETAEGVIY